MPRDSIKYCEQMIGQRLLGMEVDLNENKITFNFENGFVIFEGEDFDAYFEIKETN